MKYLLDCDTCIGILGGSSVARTTFESQPPDTMAITVLGYEELRGMTWKFPDPLKWAKAFEALSTCITVLPYDVLAAREAHRIKRDGELPAFRASDRMLLGVAITHHLTLVTHRVDGFDEVPGLEIVDWMPDIPPYGAMAAPVVRSKKRA